VRFIDLRSDTATRPTSGMRDAIARAEVGDEQKREDPTVNELERRAATLVGQQEAVFLPTATMANQIALRILSEPGDELLADAWSHLFLNELGGPAVHSGLVMRPLAAAAGRFDAGQVREAVWDRRDTHRPITRLVSIENTNNSAGGRIWPLDEIVAVADVCRELDLHVPLLADDHARARRLAEGWHAAGLAIALEQVETNFVQLDVEPLGLGKWDVIAALREGGVGVSNTVHPTRLRAVTHLDVSDEDIEAAIELAPEALAARV